MDSAIDQVRRAVEHMGPWHQNHAGQSARQRDGARRGRESEEPCRRWRRLRNHADRLHRGSGLIQAGYDSLSSGLTAKFAEAQIEVIGCSTDSVFYLGFLILAEEMVLFPFVRFSADMDDSRCA
jgi:hypothetical protein